MELGSPIVEYPTPSNHHRTKIQPLLLQFVLPALVNKFGQNDRVLRIWSRILALDVVLLEKSVRLRVDKPIIY